jgi:hypothetical protein
MIESSRLPAFRFSLAALTLAMLACRGRADAEKQPAETRSVAQPRAAQAADAPAPPPKSPAEPKAAARDITVPPPDVDLYVINGRNILSAPVGDAASAEHAKRPGGAGERVRVTFWTTPEGLKLPEPQQFEGWLAELDLGLGDLPMLSPGQKRRIWIPGPTGMATLDVELFAGSSLQDDAR